MAVQAGALLTDVIACLIFLPEVAKIETVVIPSLVLSALQIGIDVLTKSLKNFDKKRSETRPKVLFYGIRMSNLLQNFVEQNRDKMEMVGFVLEDSDGAHSVKDAPFCPGGLAELEHYISTTQAQLLFISLEGLPAEKLKKSIKISFSCQILPTLLGNELCQELRGVNENSREFDLSELLNRPKVDVDLEPVHQMISDKVVLVTGGGGSIGSELCRQILTMSPKELLILDHSELNLYTIGQELKNQGPLRLLLVDLKDQALLREVFFRYGPEIVYHAAAYKHVHLVEENPFPSIINNIQGTKNLIECSLENRVSSFVLISSDKAVNPSSIMGATKRVCELLVSRAGELTQNRYCAVRFGNVLGSSGSLIPLITSQILRGGPVTITDPKMVRYFMLISEAVKLVLKAGEISNPGDINVLKMGDPVRILDLAKKVITLMGRTEDEIPIVFIGKKPGEKLFEELYITGNEISSEHPDILVVPNGDCAYNPSLFKGEALEFVVQRLIELAYEHNKEALVLLKKLSYMHAHDAGIGLHENHQIGQAV